VSDKNLDSILPLFPTEATYYFCKPDVPRGLTSTVLQEKAETFNLIGDVYPSVNEAYKAALKNASKKDVIYVGGSTFVVAEVV
jgi:dihydrofolate synthase/folylpolyglutamate synthase